MSEILMAINDLALSAPWLRSLDINPIVFSGGCTYAVDALCIVDDTAAAEGEGGGR